MANSTLLFALAATVLALAAFSAQAHKQPPSSPAGAALPPEPYTGFYADAERCLSKLTEECGLEIFRGIFRDHDAISNKCCVELVALGRRCHRKILKATLTLPEVPKREKKEILRRDAKVWSQCVLVSDALKHGHHLSPSL
ncbi:hypothetical protein Sango_2827200 [Sesamum angolense]|uniref:Prolamin-like domain-containing protein n=1 Tax=Sesamum angolense TaxID=2727404 RepID=A0AAE1T7I3_9LAMI|nr:hypothetical protein Sango_2827200 [Sesamum angolense]